jgi:hypothetical protein
VGWSVKNKVSSLPISFLTYGLECIMYIFYKHPVDGIGNSTMYIFTSCQLQTLEIQQLTSSFWNRMMKNIFTLSDIPGYEPMIFYVCVELIPTRNTSKSMMV